MNPRERFTLCTSHQPVDRPPVDFGKHIGSFHKSVYYPLRGHLGLPEVEGRVLDRMAQNMVLDEDLLQSLGIDFRWVLPKWVEVQDQQIDGELGYVDMWQTPHKYTDVGEYYAIAGHPLGSESLTETELDQFAWPDPNNPAMFSGLGEQAKTWFDDTEYVVGADGIKAGVLQTSSQLRGYDKLFLDFALNPDLAHAILTRVTDLIVAMYRNYMDVVGPFVQVVVITDDQGTQKSLMVSPKMFRTYIKPRLQRIVEAIKEKADVKVLMHCDGAILPIIEDLIEIGVDILNPIQNVVQGLSDTRALKERFGSQLCFHGTIDVQQFLPNAAPAAVREEVGRRVEEMGKDGGLIIAPCHNINRDIPLENICAFFESASQIRNPALAGIEVGNK
jgi:uroporphyrinogen decarboxylase